MKSTVVFTGISKLGIDEAIQNALENAENPTQFKVIEIQGSSLSFLSIYSKKITRVY